MLKFVYNMLPLVYMKRIDPMTQFRIIYIYNNSPQGLFISYASSENNIGARLVIFC